MNDWISIALKEIFEAKLKQAETFKALQVIESDLETEDFSKLTIENMRYISYYIHQLYVTPSPLIRASLIRIIALIESNFSQTISELFQLDKIVAISAMRDPPEQLNFDDEKAAVFYYTNIMAQYWKIPDSVIYALAFHYNSEKAQCQIPIISVFASDALNRNDILPIESQILTEHFSQTGSKDIALLFGHALEYHYSWIERPGFLRNLVQPLVSLTESNTTSFVALAKLLQMWSGLISFGIRSHALSDLVRAISHQPSSVIAIFKELLRLDCPKRAAIESYSGFVFSQLLKAGIVDELIDISKSSKEAASFLSFILPYSDRSISAELPSTFNALIEDSVATSAILNLTLCKSPVPTSVIGFSLSPDPETWNWHGIYILLTVILPYNESESKSKDSKLLFTRLADYFHASFIYTEEVKSQVIADTFIAFYELLLSLKIVNSRMKEASLWALKTVCSQTLQSNSPCWVVLRSIFRNSQNPSQILQDWGVIESIKHFPTQKIPFSNLTRLLDIIPVTNIEIYRLFMDSPDDQLSLLALDKLRPHLSNSPSLFGQLLLPFMKQTKRERLSSPLNITAKLINDDEFRKVLIGDDQACQIIRNNCHEIYSKILKENDVMDELTWWLNVGNLMYVKEYDRSVELTFEPSKDSDIEYPSIVFMGRYPLLPPHLFGELAKTESGNKLVQNHISDLIDDTRSNDLSMKRASLFALAHYASSPLSDGYVGPIIDALFEMSLDDPLLLGTLIVCLSIFHISDTLSEKLRDKKWQIFKFGSHKCVVPIDLPPLDKSEVIQKVTPLKDIEGKEEICQIVKDLIHPQLFKDKKNRILQILKENPDHLLTSEMALFVYDALGKYGYSDQARLLLWQIFRNIPIVAKSGVVENAKIDAECKASLLELTATNSLSTFRNAKRLIMTIDELKRHPRGKLPDVYLCDEEFQSLAKMTKEQFYKLKEESEREAIRKQILS